MDEQALRVFLSLAETENTRDTGALLRVNQSNVSRALARLEEHVGMELFTRRGKRLELNGRGLAFRPDAAAVLDAMDLARRHAEAIADGARLLRIGFLHSLARWMVPRYVSLFREIHPDVPVSLRQGFGRDLYRWLDADLIDIVLCAAPVAPTSRIVWEEREREDLCIAVPTTHRLAQRGSATLADLAGADFIGFSTMVEMHHHVDALLREAGVSVRVTFESSEIDTMRSLVAGGLGLSILPRSPGRTDPGVVYFPLGPDHVRHLGIAWNRQSIGARYAADLVRRSRRPEPRTSVPGRPSGG